MLDFEINLIGKRDRFHLAGRGMDEIDRIITHEVDTAFRELGGNPDGRLVIVEKAVDYGFTVGIGEDWFSENVGRV